MLGIVSPPPSAGALHALLDDVAVGAFNFSRTNRQIALDCVLIIELVCSVIEVAVALPHRGIAVLHRRRFKVGLQRLQDCVGLLCFEPGFLLIHPPFVRLLIAVDGLAGSAEIVTHMKEIDQVAALRAKFFLNLIGYPWRAVADAMNRGVRAKPCLDRTVKKALPGRINITQ